MSATPRLEYNLNLAAHIDGEILKTPAGNLLVMPNKRMADRIAAEWQRVHTKNSKYQSDLLKYANTTLDHVAKSRDSVVEGWLGYVATDMLFYRADEPADLVRAQTLAWRPVLGWVEQLTGEQITTIPGLAPRPQSPALLEKLRHHASCYDDFRLCALAQGGGLLGSSLLALALVEGVVDAEAAYAAALCEELFQSQKWGEPEDLAQRRQHFRQEIDNLVEFIRLSGVQTPE
jgi:chaperone required for assembly of F1-ATPase